MLISIKTSYSPGSSSLIQYVIVDSELGKLKGTVPTKDSDRYWLDVVVVLYVYKENVAGNLLMCFKELE